MKTIGSKAFVKNYNSSDTKKITKVVFPSGLESIQNYALCGYREEYDEYNGTYYYRYNTITELDFSKAKKLKEIGNYAFYNNQLTNIEIPSSVKIIGTNTFYGNKLTNVEIPSSIITIYMSSFPKEVMNNYYDTDGLLIINGNLLDYTGTSKDVIIPESVTSIGIYAFSDNKLTSVTIKGKSSSTDFTSYPSSTPFGWATGYSDSNITWEGTQE